MSKKTLLSGVKPTGRPHIGNYFGAMKQFVDLQHEYDNFVMIADYHTLNFIQNREEMSENIISVALDYLAIGLDPEKVAIFKQSDISEHTELAWIFDTITTMPYLERAHAFKDAKAKNKEISVGTFNYPMLMAADILLYDPHVVPVGLDQKQHVEYTRDTAEKFNRIFGETFTLPEPIIMKELGTVPGTDGQKMSKSYSNTIPLFASDEEIKKAVMSILTDSGSDIPANVYNIHLPVYSALHGETASLAALYEEKKGKYKELKEALISDLILFIKPLREKREILAKDIGHVKEVLKAGGKKAKAKASAKMEIVREKIGVSLSEI
jgi:tryptophanyl-tRNA synthetase